MRSAPQRRGRLPENRSRHRRITQMESVRCARAMCRGIGRGSISQLSMIEPGQFSVRDDEWQRIVMLRTNVNEMMSAPSISVMKCAGPLVAPRTCASRILSPNGARLRIAPSCTPLRLSVTVSRSGHFVVVDAPAQFGKAPLPERSRETNESHSCQSWRPSFE